MRRQFAPIGSGGTRVRRNGFTVEAAQPSDLGAALVGRTVTVLYCGPTTAGSRSPLPARRLRAFPHVVTEMADVEYASRTPYSTPPPTALAGCKSRRPRGGRGPSTFSGRPQCRLSSPTVTPSLSFCSVARHSSRPVTGSSTDISIECSADTCLCGLPFFPFRCLQELVPRSVSVTVVARDSSRGFTPHGVYSSLCLE